MTLEEVLALPDGLYENIAEEIYHQVPYFSASYAKKLVINPALTRVVQETNSAMSNGSAVHAFMLEGKDALHGRFYFLPADAPKKPTSVQVNAKKPSPETVAAIEWWAKLADVVGSRTVLPAADILNIEGAVASLRAHPCVQMRGMFQGGMQEVTIFFTDQETGIRCKARLDNLYPGIIDDLKTTRDATYYGFRREIRKWGYRLQLGAYSIAAESVGIAIHQARLAAVSLADPFPVVAGEFTQRALEEGQKEFCRALNLELECRQMNQWPNIQLPEKLESLYQIYSPDDGRIIKDDALWQTFDIDRWEDVE